MHKIVFVAVLIIVASTANAAKCRGGKSILYTQDQYCPAGYTDITTDRGGTVSSVGKSDLTIQQEQRFLQQRATENGQYQAQITQAQQQFSQQQASNASLCASLSSQARSVESSMRQPNGAQYLDYLKQQHRNIRDQMYRNKC
ncbi:hypothetical protein RN01_16715 [Cupriavidus sp. SHE]|uniref:hypothetical protein n=1 Tax=Cupriavidus TaxID=106589 RepID=UPI0005798F17|nr:hypothetical protein [Cupriavidus sp. SHE]KWR81187.1 hypothetical protein RN01_16715 [Cupriavidus sp. SHE]